MMNDLSGLGPRHEHHYLKRVTVPLLSFTDLSLLQSYFDVNGLTTSGRTAPPAPVELVVGSYGMSLDVIDLERFPGTWASSPLPDHAELVGLCLPVLGDPSADRLYLGAAISRSGRGHWFTIDAGVVTDGSPSCLLIEDLCRARLCLASAPPTGGADWYWLGEWLRDVLGEPVGPAPLSVLDTAAAHPAVEMSDLAGLDLAGVSSLLVERQRDHAFFADWYGVRESALADEHHDLHRLAIALDAGAFSRWASAMTPPLSSVAESLIRRCSPLALQLIGTVIADVVLRQRVGEP